MIEFIKHINFFEWLKFYKTSEKDDFNKNYRPVEYLQSDGNQYIITPFYYDVGDIGTPPIYNIKCRCCINDNYSIFGIYRAFNLTGSSGKMRFYGYTDRQNLLTDINTGTELNNWELLNKNLYCNGIIQNTTPDYFNNVYGFGGGDNIYLFGRAGLDDNGGICKISNFYVSAKNPNTGTITEICDLVACIRKSDNKPGMYDKVSQTFLTNQGTGEFKTPIYGYLSGNPPFTFNSNGNPLVDYTISGNAIQSGTPTPENPVMPQGTGERTGNLWDEEYPNISGTIRYIPLYVGEGSFTLSTTTPYDSGIANVFLLSGNVSSGASTPGNGAWLNHNVTAQSDGGYITIAYRHYINTTSPADCKTMLNTGSTPLPYEPYGYKIPISSANTTTTVYLGEVETTRKIRKLVLTGEESWTYEEAYSRFWINVADFTTLGLRLTPFISNAFGSISDGRPIADVPDNTIYSGATGSVDVHKIFIKTTEYTSAADFKTYLQQQYSAGTPVTVWYVLAEPTTGIVNDPLMKIGDYADTVSKAQAGVEIPTINGSNTLTVDTTLQPSEVSIVYKK